MAQVNLSVVIPAYNEAQKIEQDLEFLFKYLNQQPFSFEVIVVDDGSIDQTFERVQELTRIHRNLICLRHSSNRGKGYAVREGVLKAEGEYILFADAGTCVDYKEVERGIALLGEGNSVAIGSRALAKSTIVKPSPTYRQIGARVFAWIVRNIMGIKNVTDTQCGFKIFRYEAAQAIFSKARIDGFMFDIEMIVLAQRLNLSIKEFPVNWSSDLDTRFEPFSGSIRNFWELLLIKVRI